MANRPSTDIKKEEPDTEEYVECEYPIKIENCHYESEFDDQAQAGDTNENLALENKVLRKVKEGAEQTLKSLDGDGNFHNRYHGSVWNRLGSTFSTTLSKTLNEGTRSRHQTLSEALTMHPFIVIFLGDFPLAQVPSCLAHPGKGLCNPFKLELNKVLFVGSGPGTMRDEGVLERRRKDSLRPAQDSCADGWLLRDGS